MTETRYYGLQGGLDLVTPAIQVPPGRAIAAVNYEPNPRGYQRIDGFERLDGHPKPSEASYWVLGFDASDTEVQEGDTVTGGTSSATGVALIDGVVESGSYVGGDAAGYLVLTAVSGTFQDDEDLEVSAAKVAEADGVAIERGALTDENDSTWYQDAIETARDNISAVPGSGPVRGVHVYKGDVYAFRDNAGGTAGVMHKATASGWSAQSLGSEIPFRAGTAEFAEGETLTGGSSSATATIERVVAESGGWSSAWSEVATRFPVSGVTSAVAITALNETDIAFFDAANDDLRTYRLTSGVWAQVGNDLNIASAGNPAIARLTNSRIAFIDGSNDSLSAYEFDGSDWAIVGSGLSVSTVSGPALAALNETDVAFIDATNDELRCYRFDGAAWSLVGSGLAISTVGTPALAALNATDVAFIDSTNQELRTYRFSGSAWSQVGNSLSVASGGPELAVLNDSDVVLIDTTNTELRVYRFDGTDWAPVGDAMPIATMGVAAITALSSTDIAFIDNTNKTLRAYRYDDTANAEGRLILSSVTGTFTDGEAITSALGAAIASGANAAITLPDGGRYDIQNYNFFGASDLERMYGVNGEGYGFEWDGSIFVPIHTGMVDDRPTRVAIHRNHLFFAYRGGSVQHSSIGNPYEWQVLTGAGELGIGEETTDLVAAVSGILTILGRNKTAVLFGDDAANWELRTLADDAGGVAWTAQMIGAPIYLDNRGLRSLETTDKFGDFQVGTITQLVEPIFRTKRQDGVTAVGSLRVRAKDQYRLFWSDGTGLTVYFGSRGPEILPFDLGFTVTCTASGKDSTGDEVLLAGDDSGMVYELDAGTNLDGEAVEAFLRLPFNHVGSPAQRKRWQKAVMEMDGGPTTMLGLVAEFGYADSEQPPGQEQTFSVKGSGGLWDELRFDEFYWSSPVEGQAESPIDGLGRNISITVVSDATYEEPHLLHGLILYFTYRGIVR